MNVASMKVLTKLEEYWGNHEKHFKIENIFSFSSEIIDQKPVDLIKGENLEENRSPIIRQGKPKTGDLQCLECNFCTDKKQRLKYHFESLHLKLLRYQCGCCNKRNYYIHDLQKHMRKIHKVKEFKSIKYLRCTKCKEKVDHVDHEYLISDYRFDRYRKNDYKCLQCEFLGSSYALKVHVRREHHEKDPNNRKVFKHKAEGELKCDKCTYTTNYINDLKNHIKRVHMNILKYQCGVCSKRKFFLADLKRHIRDSHPNLEADIKYLKCSWCITDSSHTNHEYEILDLKDIKDFRCLLCMYSTKFERLLKKHCRKKHGDIKDKESPLKVKEGTQRVKKCTRKVKEGSPKVKQSTSKTKEVKESPPKLKEKPYQQLPKDFQCLLCIYSSKSAILLKAHFKKKHKIVKDKTCVKELKNENCQPLKNSTLENRANHSSKNKSSINESTGEHKSKRRRKENRYKCKSCSDLFSNINNLIKHFRKSHPGSNIFTCSECEYGTNYQPNLNVHIQSRHEKKQIKCNNCDFSTTWIPTYHQHMRLKHNIFQKKSKHNEGRDFICEKCSFTARTSLVFNNHVCNIQTAITGRRERQPEGSKRNKYKCNKCNFGDTDPKTIRKHVDLEHPIKA